MASSPAKPPGVPSGSTYSQGNPQAGITMDLSALWQVGKTTIPGYVTALTDALEKISKALGDIELNWAGDSQKEANDFNTRWQNCANALFGTKKDPERGVLNRLAAGVQGAVLNYDNTEGEVVAMWKQYTDMLTLLANGSTPESGRDGSGTPPISEV